MGAVREKELRAGLDVLGVRDHAFLGYRDATCASVDEVEATTKMRVIIESFEPDTILTFGPDGMTDHPDHKAVCAWTTRAFADAAPAGASLFYATVTPEWKERFLPVMNRFNVFAEGRPPTTPRGDLAIDYQLPSDVLELKLGAIDCHESQVEAMMEAFGRNFFREAHDAEYFNLADSK
jgi:LmbE family N-acetylglucosaminyl deacetylase